MPEQLIDPGVPYSFIRRLFAFLETHVTADFVASL